MNGITCDHSPLSWSSLDSHSQHCKVQTRVRVTTQDLTNIHKPVNCKPGLLTHQKLRKYKRNPCICQFGDKISSRKMIFYQTNIVALQIALVADCTCCRLHLLQIARIADCTCCRLYVLQIAHVADCNCCKLHVL